MILGVDTNNDHDLLKREVEMSEVSWFVGVICGIIISVASVPFAVSYARYQDFDLQKAYISEVKKTIPYAIREYLKDRPWHSFFLKYFTVQSTAEEIGAELAEVAIKEIVPEEETYLYYLQMYLNIVLPAQFKYMHAKPVISLLTNTFG